jgi:hypothetical protein
MKPPVIESVSFEDITGLPEVHSDERRTIYEKIEQTEDGAHRISRSVVNADEAILGNHYHDFNQTFRGCGEGTIYTASKDDPTNITKQALPAAGWAFAIPAGMIMTLRLKKGAIQIFESDKDYQDGANTHRVVIVNPFSSKSAFAETVKAMVNTAPTSNEEITASNKKAQ